MCGIAGKVGSAPVSETEIVRMCDAIQHRGPDDSGFFVEEGVGLGMRRLEHHRPGRRPPADVQRGRLGRPRLQRRDLQLRASCATACSPAAMSFAPAATPRSWSTSTRRRASGSCPASAACSRSRSGTDAAAACCSPATTSDRSRCSTPRSGGRLAFASEIKALLADDSSLRTLNPYALDQYLALRFVSPPDTLFAKIQKLPPAHYLVWENGRSRVARYWDLDYGPKWTYSEHDTLARVEELLAEAVRLHLVSDVPVGAFLSGGLDSTLIAAFAAQTVGGELRTFSMGIPHGSAQRAAGGGGSGGPLRHAASCRGDSTQRHAGSASADHGAGRAGRSAVHLPAASEPHDGPARQGRLGRRRW